jgi:hypothetical protein
MKSRSSRGRARRTVTHGLTWPRCNAGSAKRRIPAGPPPFTPSEGAQRSHTLLHAWRLWTLAILDHRRAADPAACRNYEPGPPLGTAIRRSGNGGARPIGIAGALVLATLWACGSATTPATTGTRVVLGLADAARTVQVRVGDTIEVTLEDDFPVPGSALVWDVTSSNETVLTPGSVSRSSPAPSGPGKRDTYTATFQANATGQAVLDARGATSCEAMPKTNCPDRDFKITVVVSG